MFTEHNQNELKQKFPIIHKRKKQQNPNESLISMSPQLQTKFAIVCQPNQKQKTKNNLKPKLDTNFHLHNYKQTKNPNETKTNQSKTNFPIIHKTKTKSTPTKTKQNTNYSCFCLHNFISGIESVFITSDDSHDEWMWDG